MPRMSASVCIGVSLERVTIH